MEPGYELRQFCGSTENVKYENVRQPERYPVRYYQSHGVERDWAEGGIDNDGLDISQLESYINDDNNDSMYFNELAAAGGNVGNHPPGNPRLHQPPHHMHHTSIHLNNQNNSQVLRNSQQSTHNSQAPRPPERSSSNKNMVHVMNAINQALSGTDAPISTHRTSVSAPIGYDNPYNQYRSTNGGFRHHLPDSPQSEPPYSPQDQPNLSPQQKPAGLTELYNLPTPPGSGGGGIMNIPYTVLQQQQQQQQQSHSLPPTITPSSLPHTAPCGTPLTHSVHNSGLHPQLHNSTMGGYPPVILPSGVMGNQTYVQNGSHLPGDGMNPGKKRKIDGDPSNMINGIKQEPEMKIDMVGPTLPPPSNGQYGEEDEYGMDGTSGGCYLDGSYQCIRFSPFQQHTWAHLADSTFKELPMPAFRVDADKGFNFSNPDESFVCQKKNHFQVTVHCQASGDHHYVKSPMAGHLLKVDRFCIHFFGVKTESPTQVIRVEQSQSDRSKKAFHPVPMDLKSEAPSKMTVGRMHFSETTSNNMRKKGKPNPDQRYFYLVVALKAHAGDQAFTICASASEKIIVRASNPGQFESDMEYTFQRGSIPESIYHMGRVGINTPNPEEALVIHGNLKLTGQVVKPSDQRVKDDIKEVDSKEQLENVKNLRVVSYAYKKEFADSAGIHPDERYETGVIAQEVKKIIPDAVKEGGTITLTNGKSVDKFLMVNKERIFMENVGAVKELCNITGNLENRIGELEKMKTKISKINRFDSFKSTTSTVSTRTTGVSSISASHNSSRGCSHKRYKQGLGSPRDGFCNARALHLTTITLVCLMAFCLLTMTSIYIVDRINSPHGPPVSTSAITSSTATYNTGRTTYITLNFTSTDLSSSFSTSHMTSSDEATSTDSTLTSVLFTTTSSTTTPITPYPLPNRPPALGIRDDCPPVPDPEEQLCDVYCCTSKFMVGAVSPAPSSASLSRHHYGIDYRTSAIPSVSQNLELITNKLSTNDPIIYSLSTTQAQNLGLKPQPMKKSNIPDQIRRRLYYHRTNLEPRPSSSRSFKQTLSKRSIKNKRSSNLSNLRGVNTDGMPRSIEILELHVGISALYCLNLTHEYFLSCQRQQADNFTYALPISMFMSLTNLTLDFNYPGPVQSPPSFCPCQSNCSGWQETYPPEQCQADEHINSSEAIVEPQENSSIRVLLTNVGKYKSIVYKLRVPILPTLADSPEVNPCSYDDNELGNKFKEYNFIFYRVCDE